MKLSAFVILMVFTCLFTACEKSASTSLEGKFNVTSDSSIISGGTTLYNVYRGNDADYFIFKNGILYTKESSLLDTFSYKIISPDSLSLTQISVSTDAITGTGTYIFTGNNVRISISPNVLNPGFAFRRIINLRR